MIERLACSLELPLRLRFLRNVASDFRKADDLAIIVGDRIDNHMRPEARPILAETPSFLLKTPGFASNAQGVGWRTGLHLFGKIEAREMLADDFVRPVSFDTFGARIPADHRAVRVKHVDRVIGHTSNEDAKLFFAPAQGLLSRPPLGQVTGDLGVADQFRAAPDWVNHDVSPEPDAVLAEPPTLSLEPPRFSSG